MPFRAARIHLATAILALACPAVSAQTVQQPAVSPTVTVQQLAPQLVAFAGSPLNFQSLVTGLAQGTPVQLVTVLPNGLTQLVTFTPGAPMQATDIVNTLERARQQLIGLGIGAPTAEQLAFTLMGGTVPTPLGGAPVAGLINAPSSTTGGAGPQRTPSVAAQVQARTAAGGATTAPNPPAAPGTPQDPVSVQLIPAIPPTTPGVVTGVPTPSTPVPGAVTGTPTVTARPNTSDSRIAPGSTSASPIPVIPNSAPGLGSSPPAARAGTPGAAGTPPAARR